MVLASAWSRDQLSPGAPRARSPSECLPETRQHRRPLAPSQCNALKFQTLYEHRAGGSLCDGRSMHRTTVLHYDGADSQAMCTAPLWDRGKQKAFRSSLLDASLPHGCVSSRVVRALAFGFSWTHHTQGAIIEYSSWFGKINKPLNCLCHGVWWIASETCQRCETLEKCAKYL